MTTTSQPKFEVTMWGTRGSYPSDPNDHLEKAATMLRYISQHDFASFQNREDDDSVIDLNNAVRLRQRLIANHATFYDDLNLPDYMDELGNEIKIRCLRQYHPQETYGWRIEYLGKVFAFGADNEPFAGFEDPDPNLVELFRQADVGINDGQYSFEQYLGKKEEGGISRRGWGHAFPESNAHLIVQSGVKRFYTTHHDPASKDRRIWELAGKTRELVLNVLHENRRCIEVEAAHEGLTINVLQ